MLLRPVALALALVLPPALPAQAADAARIAELLRMDEAMEVLREEGIAYGEDLQAELLGGAGGARWDRMVELIYDPVTLRRRFDRAFARELPADSPETAAIAEFLGSDRGQRIVVLEIEARRALLDPAVEDAARLALDRMREARDPLLDDLQRFAEVNDLVESNVIGALNANLAFYRGMSEAGAFGTAMPEEDMLAEVWAQEDDIRAETVDWLFPFLSLAYSPLPPADFDAYLAFSESEAGQRLNRAIFAAFDQVFARVSHDLGRAAAGVLAGQDL